MIILNLLHPSQPVPVQSWTFETESLVRIGRARDNDVVVHSAVVSRLHVELKRQTFGWEVISLGTNGTYLNGERIHQVKAVDGMIIRLGTSGPKIQIWIDNPTATPRGIIAEKRSSSQDSAVTSANPLNPNVSNGSSEPTQTIPTFLTTPQTLTTENPTRRED